MNMAETCPGCGCDLDDPSDTCDNPDCPCHEYDESDDEEN